MKLFLGIFFIYLLGSSNSWAQLENPNFLPMGDIESFMGNAGSAGIRSPGAVFYNPAAISEVKKGVSVNGSNFMKVKYEANPIFNIDNEDLKYTASAFAAVPISIINIFRIKKWRFGFSYLMPHNIEFENNIQYRTSGPLKAKFNLIQTYKVQDYMLGLTAARKISKHFAVGISLFGNKHFEYVTTSSTAAFTAVPTYASATNERKLVDVHMGNAVLGVQYRNRVSRVGLSIRTPSFVARSKGSYYNNVIEVDTTVPSIKEKTTQEERVHVSYKIPPDILIGYSTLLFNKFVWAIDVGHQFGTSFRVFKGSAGDDNVVKMQGTFRFRSGIAYKIKKFGHLFAGFGITPSAKKPLEEQENGGRFDYKTVTFGLRIKNGALYTGIGSYYTWGRGESRINNYPTAGEYRRGKVRVNMHGVLLNVGYQM